MGEIQGGASLFEAFNKHPRVFSHLYRSMIAAGEASGSLPDVLERLIYIIQHEFKVKQDIRSALAYPIIVVITLAIAFFILLTFVVPKFAAIFKSAGIDLPMPTRVAMAMYSFLDNYWYLLLGAVAAVVVGLGMYFKTEQGRFLRDSLLIQVPLLGSLFIKSAMSRFASIFAILQASGVSVLDSLRILSDTINNAAISREFDRLETQLKEGRGISQPLRSARYFTPMIINMVAIGEESGNLDEMLRESAEHYDHEVEYAVGQLTTAMGPILVVALAGVVGFFALAIFLPMWDLVKTVQM
jgi:type IV pilus assembly protein PilC